MTVRYQKMRKNQDDFEELCESIVNTVTILEKITPHGVDATSSLKQLCEDLQRYGYQIIPCNLFM
jgi:hypothetical protein